FTSGVEAVDNFFKRTAGKLARAENLRLYVMTNSSGSVIGFHAVNAHAIEYGDLPAKYARSRPRHGAIPAAFIAMIGVGLQWQGQGFGGDLLADALTRIGRAADAIGIAVVVLDVLDEGDEAKIARRKAIYERYGFRPLPSQPLRLFLPMATVRRLLIQELG
ncbi:MAG: GNAT family N-acetyltransferase, partial [Caulobacteraceae bacterium]